MDTSKISYGLAYGALKGIALLPLGVLYGVSDFLAFMARSVLKYRVKVVRKNLQGSFPEKSEKELRDIEKAFYRHLCDCIVETVKLLHISDRELKKRVVVTNPEFVEKTISENPSVVLFLAHYGNWEWVPVTTLQVKSDIIMGSLYKPLLSKLSDRIAGKLRGRLGIRLIPTRSAYRDMLRMKEAGERFMIGFISDQRPLGQPLNHWTWFLNRPTAFVGGGETIGDRVGAKFLYLEMEKTRRGHYTLTFKDIEPVEGAPDFPYTRSYYRLLEQTIRRDPRWWLWSHNRWKATPPEGVVIPQA